MEFLEFSLFKRKNNTNFSNLNNIQTKILFRLYKCRINYNLLFSEIQGFMKTMFTMAKNDKYGTFLFTNGSITDGLYKLDIRIRKNDGNDIFDFQKGEKVQVKGQMNFGGK